LKYPLYDYQEKVYQQVIALIKKGVKRILCQLPTRAGKSLIATAIIENNLKDKKRTWFLCHTNVLINQMSEELTTHGIRHGIITPRHNSIKYRTQIISKDTLSNRIRKMRKQGWEDPHTILVDETHLAISKIYFELLKLFPETEIIGLTATPVRLDGKGLDSLYDELIIGPSIKELQAKKRLCNIETYQTQFDATGLHSRGGDFKTDEVLERVDKPKVLKNIVRHWEQLAKGKKTLTFCASIAHAQHMADEFNNAGYPSIAVSSEDPAEVIAQKVKAYYAGKYINLVSVQLFIMGFTVKDCECIIQTRPTQSLMIYLQTVGRGMVYLPGKTLINLDCVNNVERHGLPEADRQWSLIGKPQKEKDDKTELKRCIACLEPTNKKMRYCENCGFDFAELKIDTGRSRTPEESEGQLIKVVDNK
jgi:superfamily II DNA or RNA helicase